MCVYTWVQILKQRPSGSRQYSQCSCSCSWTRTWTWTCSCAHCCSWTNCLPWCVPLPFALTPFIRAHLMWSTEAPPSSPRPGDASAASSSGAASPGVIAGSVIGALVCKMTQPLHNINRTFCFPDYRAGCVMYVMFFFSCWSGAGWLHATNSVRRAIDAF